MRISDWSSDVCSSDLALNSLIVAVLVFGILYTFRQVLMIGREASWVEDWKKTQQGAATGNAGEPSNLLAPLAKMLESRGPRGSLSAAATRALLDSVGSRLAEARDLPRSLTGLMEIGSASCREGGWQAG